MKLAGGFSQGKSNQCPCFQRFLVLGESYRRTSRMTRAVLQVAVVVLMGGLCGNDFATKNFGRRKFRGLANPKAQLPRAHPACKEDVASTLQAKKNHGGLIIMLWLRSRQEMVLKNRASDTSSQQHFAVPRPVHICNKQMVHTLLPTAFQFGLGNSRHRTTKVSPAQNPSGPPCVVGEQAPIPAEIELHSKAYSTLRPALQCDHGCKETIGWVGASDSLVLEGK